MSSTQRNLLLFLGSLLLAIAIAALLLLDGEQPGSETTTAPTLTGPVTMAEESTPRARSSGVRSLATERRNLNGLCELLVEVYSEDGEPLYEALVTPTLPVTEEEGGLSPIARLQPARWSDFPPGAVTVSVECEGYLPHSELVSLTADESSEVRIELVRNGRVRGTVRSPTGQPVSTTVWLLEPGQEHPESSLEARHLESVRTDRFGRFKVDFPEERNVRFSVGQPGKAHVIDTGARYFRPGERHEVDVVLAESCDINVRVNGIPQDSELAIGVAVERREKIPGSGGGKGGKRRIETAEGFGVQGDGYWWRPVANAGIDSKGKAKLRVSQPGKDHRLVVTIGGRTHTSETSFGIRRGRPLAIQATPPADAFERRIPTSKPTTTTAPTGRTGGGGGVIGVGRGRQASGKPAGSTGGSRPPKEPLRINVSPAADASSAKDEGLYWKKS